MTVRFGVLVVVGWATTSFGQTHQEAGYVGAKACEACHAAQAASHGHTGHAQALKKAPAGSPGEWAFGAGHKAIT